MLAKLECEPAPLLLGYVLGPLLEEHLRRAMILGRGDPLQFLARPISLAFVLGTGAAARVDGLAGAAAGKELVGRLSQ